MIKTLLWWVVAIIALWAAIFAAILFIFTIATAAKWTLVALGADI